MPQNNDDPFDFVKRLAESYRQIRFGPGVVGKTGRAIFVLMVIWGIVIWKLTENIWLDILLFVGGFIASGICVWWIKSTQKFAKDNPHLALLEGAELLEYQKFEAQVKGLPGGNPGPLLVDSKKPTSDFDPENH